MAIGRRMAWSGILAALCIVGPAARTPVEDAGPPFPPAASMATMQLEAGYRMELVANEPDVQSPVAMDIDETGRLFVVEMPGYPLDTRPTGRVKLLEDTDGDGRYDRTRIFADGLVLPTGVMRWKRGVLVTAAPDLLYFEDTDGDGRADVRHVLVTGFALTNPQHTVNTPVYGLDNWVYLAHAGPAEAIIYKDLFGDHGRPLTWPEHPDRPAFDPLGRSVRLRPDTGAIEALGADSQFGHGFDRWGHYFTNDNSNHARHEVVAARYLARNPQLLVPTAMQDIPDHGSAARVFPITRRPTFELLTESGQFTSACAITPYAGGLFPESGGPSIFVAEPVHNLVHRDVLVPAGATFVAKRATEDKEFLAAGDSWFRPVFLYVGPDAALYVVDYYRARIEHPEWSASDLQRNPAPLYEGQDRGRIYRITPGGTSVPARPVALAGARDDALVAELENPNLWWRRTAQRLLVDRQARAAVPALRTLAKSGSAVARVHALWTLDALGALDDDLVRAALEDEVAGVRENAVQLAEPRLAGSAALTSRLVAMEHDPDSRVRFSVLAALGGLTSPEAAAVRDRMLLAHIDDRWMQVAALSAGSDRALSILDAATRPSSPVRSTVSAGRASLLEQVASMVAARETPSEIEAALGMVTLAATPADAWWRAATLRGLAAGARGHGRTSKVLGQAQPALLALNDDKAADVRDAAFDLLRIAGPTRDARWTAAITHAMAAAQRGDAGRRADAIALVSLDRPDARTAWFESFVTPREPEGVQLAAVRALGRAGRDRDGEAMGAFLLERWAAFTPGVRSEAAQVLLGRETRTRQLIAAMRDGRVQPWTLDFWQKRDLVMHDNPAIRAEARALIEEDPRQRAQTVRRYAAALDLAGDAAKGQHVFTRVCAACHRLDGQGAGDLGPDLATVRHRPPLNLLGDILLPSQSIAQHYETWVIERTSGGTEAGVLGAQTPATVTLRQGQGRAVTIRRSDIHAMRVAPQSSMPADLDKVIAPDEMADLLAYIRGQ